MTRIGMALDASGKPRIGRRNGRGAVIAQVVIGLVAIAELSGAGWLVTQRGVSTVVAVEDLLAEVRQPQSPSGTEVAPPAPTTDAAQTAESPATSIEAAGGTDAAAVPVADDETDSAPAATPAPAPAAADGTSPAQPSTAPAPTAPAKTFSLPGEGIYAYASEGYETISLGGARHDYPSRTYAIVEHQDGCEWTFDHRVVEEKRTVSTYCNEGPVQSARAYDGWITFYGSTAESHYACNDGTRSDLRDRPGSEHEGACTDGEGTSSDTVRFVGVEVMTIGGQRVDALHYRIDTVLTGSVVGTSTQDVWVHPADATMLRLQRDTETSAYEFGAQVDYVEHAVFMLESLTPQR